MSSPRTIERPSQFSRPSELLHCKNCDRVLPYVSQGPDLEAWAEWQKPHWTEVLNAWPSGKHADAIIDYIRALGTLVLLTGIVIALLAGLG